MFDAICSFGRWLWRDVLRPLVLDAARSFVTDIVKRLLQAAADLAARWTTRLARWADSRLANGADEKTTTGLAIDRVVDVFAGVASALQARHDAFDSMEDALDFLSAEFEAAAPPVGGGSR